MSRFQLQQSAPIMFRSQPMQQNMTGPAGAPAGDPAGQTTDPTTPPATGPNVIPSTPPAPTEAERVAALPQWAQKELSDARADAAKARTDAKAQAVADAEAAWTDRIGKALGLVKDDGQKLSTEQLAEQVTAAQGQARQAALELAIYRGSTGVANPDALLDSRTFLASVKDLDPATEGEKITAAIKAAAEKSPVFRAVQATGTSGADFTGGSGERPNHPAHDAQPGFGRVAAAFATPSQ